MKMKKYFELDGTPIKGENIGSFQAPVLLLEAAAD
jgi:hypothetical protein